MNKLGFGFLRLPQTEGEIDYPLLNQMVDAFLAHGGSYFDTAYTYLDGNSEIAIRESLVKRHPRESFVLADKLPSWKVTAYEDCWKYFDEQCQRCGVDAFDVYLLHWLNRANYGVCEKHHEFAFLRELKAAGKAKKIGVSYHDSAALLDEILTAHPEVDIVQLQINYLDWNSTAIEAGNCYRVAEKHGKSIVVMEPVKGGDSCQSAGRSGSTVSEPSSGQQHGFLGIAFCSVPAPGGYCSQWHEHHGADAGQFAGCFAVE